jgi:predicted RecB family endonuclease
MSSSDNSNSNALAASTSSISTTILSTSSSSISSSGLGKRPRSVMFDVQDGDDDDDSQGLISFSSGSGKVEMTPSSFASSSSSKQQKIEKAESVGSVKVEQPISSSSSSSNSSVSSFANISGSKLSAISQKKKALFQFAEDSVSNAKSEISDNQALKNYYDAPDSSDEDAEDNGNQDENDEDFDHNDNTAPAPVSLAELDSKLAEARSLFNNKQYSDASALFDRIMPTIIAKYDNDDLAFPLAQVYVDYGKCLLYQCQQESDAFAGGSGNANSASSASSLSTSSDAGKKDNSDDLQIAHENLEVARVIYEREIESYKSNLSESSSSSSSSTSSTTTASSTTQLTLPELELKLASVLMYLGDVSMESEQWDTAYGDLAKCLSIRKRHLSRTDRLIAATHSDMGNVAMWNNKPSIALYHYRIAAAVFSEIVVEKFNSLKSVLNAVDVSKLNGIPAVDTADAFKQIASLRPSSVANDVDSSSSSSSSSLSSSSSSPATSSATLHQDTAIVNNIWTAFSKIQTLQKELEDDKEIRESLVEKVQDLEQEVIEAINEARSLSSSSSTTSATSSSSATTSSSSSKIESITQDTNLSAMFKGIMQSIIGQHGDSNEDNDFGLLSSSAPSSTSNMLSSTSSSSSSSSSETVAAPLVKRKQKA